MSLIENQHLIVPHPLNDGIISSDTSCEEKDPSVAPPSTVLAITDDEAHVKTEGNPIPYYSLFRLFKLFLASIQLFTYY